MTSAHLKPEMEHALQALLILGASRRETFALTTEAELEHFAAEHVATPLLLADLAAAAPDDDGVPAAFILLNDPEVREALLTRYTEDFEYAAAHYNQFLLLEGESPGVLWDIYEAFVDDLIELLDVEGEGTDVAPPSREALYEAVVDHHVALWQFARQLVVEQFVAGGVQDGQVVSGAAGSADEETPEAAAPSEPVCHEYDPEFQLGLWGLTPDNVGRRLLEPILDLGCGQQGLLVRYLRTLGLDAYGIDKFAAPDEFIGQGDWLETPLEHGYWGTIISHMGFSNHFFHHHLRKDGHPERYARRFMDILRALKPGGAFLYAPGLPFFEPLLPKDKVDIILHPIEVDVDALGLMGLRDLLDGDETWGVSRRNGTSTAERRPALYAAEVRLRTAATKTRP